VIIDPDSLGRAAILRNVIPHVRPLVCCVKHGSSDRFMEPQFGCTQRFHATNVRKRPGSAVFTLKLTLATHFRGSLPYIFPGLLPLPRVAESAFGIRTSGRRHLIIGMNWAPVFKIPSGAIHNALSCRHIGESDPVTLLIHIAKPRFEFTDHGKGSLAE
jgi:hypothetical protein